MGVSRVFIFLPPLERQFGLFCRVVYDCRGNGPVEVGCSCCLIVNKIGVVYELRSLRWGLFCIRLLANDSIIFLLLISYKG